MALSFLNEVWATRLLMDLEAESVYKARGNMNYQSDAHNAKQVHIGKMTTDINVSDYAVNTDITAPEILTDSDTILALSNQKYFHFYVDSVDMAQQKPNIMSDAMRKAAIAIAQTMDTTVSAAVNSGVKTANKVTMAIANDDSNEAAGTALLEAFTEMKYRMRVENISKTVVPWAVLSSKHLQVLEKFFVLEGKTGIFLPGTSEQTLRSGFMGNLLGH